MIFWIKKHGKKIKIFFFKGMIVVLFIFFTVNRLFFFSPGILEQGASCILYPVLVFQNKVAGPIKNYFQKKTDIKDLQKLVIDLKTTAELDKFHWSAKKYNYDSQAYIYRELFGYEFIFIAVDKKTAQIGIFDCSSDFYRSGMNKVEKASEAYDLFYKTEGFDPSQYFINKTL